MRINASLSDFELTSLFTLFFYNQIINTIFIKTFLIFYLIIYVYYIIERGIFDIKKLQKFSIICYNIYKGRKM